MKENLLDLIDEVLEEDLEILDELIKEDIEPLAKYMEEQEKKEGEKALTREYDDVKRLEEEATR